MKMNDITKAVLNMNKKYDVHIAEINNKIIKNKRYVNYNKEKILNYYNEIYYYILDNNQLSSHLQSNENKNKKQF